MARPRGTFYFYLPALLLSLLLVFVCVPDRPAPANGPELLNQGRSRQVRVGTFNVQPVIFQDDAGQPRGIFVDLIRAVAEQENWRVSFVPGSFAEGVSRLQEGRIDLMSSFAYSEERARVFDYSREPILTVWSEVYVRPQSRIRNILDLQGRTVALMQGDMNAQHFRELAGQFEIRCEYLESPSLDEAFAQVQVGAADAVITPMFFGYTNAEKYGLVSSSIVFQPFPVFFAAAKGRNSDLLTAIDTRVKQWKEDPDSPYSESLDHWFAHRRGGLVIPPWLLTGLVVLALSTLIFAFWARRLKERVGQQTAILRENEEKYREVFNSTSEAIIVQDGETGAILDVNRAMTEMYGYSREEAVHLAIDDLSLGRSPYSQKEADVFFSKALAGESQVFEWQGRRKDGSVFPCEVSLQGHRVGDHTRLTAVARDISDRKLLETRLLQAQKMEAIGTLAGGIAHDFNNILGPILGYTELVQERLSADEELTADLQQVVAAALRAKDLVQQILAFSRQSTQERKPLQPQLVTKEALKLLRATLPATIDINQEIAADCGAVLIDPTQFHQIIMNLCTNAYHAMRECGGILGVRLARRTVGDTEVGAGGIDLASGDYVLLEVSDTGCGIDSRTMERIFEPYFTTKSKGEGTGLGLSMVHGIVKAWEGLVTVRSEPGRGTIFQIYLPLVADFLVPDGKSGPDDLPTGNERILVVDDDEAISIMLKALLEHLGYRVTALTESLKALALIEQNPGAFDLLITDMTMPSLTGYELSRRVLASQPGLPIILCTGFSEQIDKERAYALGIRAFMMKPLSVRELAQAIRRVLKPEA